jgi:hypothetical protein
MYYQQQQQQQQQHPFVGSSAIMPWTIPHDGQLLAGAHHSPEAAAAPRLYHDLSAALMSVYSPGSVGSGLQQHPASSGSPAIGNARDAHDVLVHVQSRNVRRKLKSLEQRRCDQGKGPPQQNNISSSNERIEMKSSWLACLFALLRGSDESSSATPSSQNPGTADTSTLPMMFSAQTLLQRLTRAKLFEAIDWEVEHPDDCDADEAMRRVAQSLPCLEESYKNWIRIVHPWAGTVLHAYNGGTRLATRGGVGGSAEDHIKGELSLVTIATIMFLVAASTS